MKIRKNLALLLFTMILGLVSCAPSETETIEAAQTTATNPPAATSNPTQEAEEVSETADTQTEDKKDESTELIGTYPIVDTGQVIFYSDTREIREPSEGDAFYGQDATYSGNQASYTDNGDGTVTDNVTGLMWQQEMDEKMSYEDAAEYAENCTLGGYDDWRVPTIKELWSLINYTGQSGGETADELYIDTDYFVQPIGDTSIGEREIDAQIWSSTIYTGLTMGDNETVFGVNFIDGRIKGYNVVSLQNKSLNKLYVRLVRGNENYGINNFEDNGDGTISDLATGLMWLNSDDGVTRDWQEALAYAENSEYAGYSDWRLPNAKELQSIVDYTKSMQLTGTAAINELFDLTEITDVRGELNYGFYWTSTTHLDGTNPYDSAAYVCFGEALGKMNDVILDVHGAGAVRSDPKSGDADDYPQYFGPQGDVRYVYNYCLLVRDIGSE